MLIRVILFIICLLYPISVSANIFSSIMACFDDPCNCGFSKKVEYWAEGDCDKCKFMKSGSGYSIDSSSCDISRCVLRGKERNPNQLCPPYNKDGGRKNFTCLTKPDLNYPTPFLPLFFEKCIEHTDDSTYKKPQLRLRTQTCNNIFCWVKNNTLSWDGQCVTLAGGYGFPLHRICARIALPEQPGSGTKGEPNYIPEKPADPGYTYGLHINNLGSTNKDPLTTLSDGTQVKFIHPKLCAYYDPAFMGISPPSVDFFDLDPNKQPLHAHTDQKSVIIKIIDFFVDAAKDVSDAAVSLIKQLIKAMSGDDSDDDSDGSTSQDGTTFWSILADVFKYIGWLIDKILDLLKKILDDIGGLNRVVEENLGCVELPIGPYPPPFWPIIVNLFDEPKTEKICHQNKIGGKMLLKELSVDFDPCAESDLENNAIHNTIRVTNDKFIPLCKSNDDQSTCVGIRNIEILHSIMQHNNDVFIDKANANNIDDINFISYQQNQASGGLYFHMPKMIANCNHAYDNSTICVDTSKVCAKTNNTENCTNALRNVRLVFNTKTGPIVNLRNTYVYDIDACNKGDPNQVTCQEIWGVNIGDFVDIPVNYKDAIVTDEDKLLPPVCSSDSEYFITNQTVLSKKSSGTSLNNADPLAVKLKQIEEEISRYNLVASIVRDTTSDEDYDDSSDNGSDKRGQCFKYSFSGQSPENICVVNNKTKELVGCQKRIPPSYIDLAPSPNSEYFKPKAIAMLSAEDFSTYLNINDKNLSNEEKNRIILSHAKDMSSFFAQEVTLPYYNGTDGNYKDFSDSSDNDYNILMNQQNILGYDIKLHATDDSFTFPPYQGDNDHTILGVKFGHYVYKNLESCYKAGDAVIDLQKKTFYCKYYTIDNYMYDYVHSMSDDQHPVDATKYVSFKNHYKTRNSVKDDDCDDDDENKMNHFDRYKSDIKYCVTSDDEHFDKKFIKKHLVYVGGIETYNYIPSDQDKKIVKDVYIRGGTKVCLDTRNTEIGQCPDDTRNCVLTYLENFDIVNCKKLVQDRLSLNHDDLNIHLCPNASGEIKVIEPPANNVNKYRPANFAPIIASEVKDQKTKDLIAGKNNIQDSEFNSIQQQKFQSLRFKLYYHGNNSDDKKTCYSYADGISSELRAKIESGLCKISSDPNKRIIPKPSEDLTQYENYPGKTYFPVDLSSPPPSYYDALRNVNQDSGDNVASAINDSVFTPMSDRKNCVDYLEPKECLDSNKYYQCDPDKCMDTMSCRQISLSEIAYNKRHLEDSGCLKDDKYDCTSAKCVQTGKTDICNKISAQSNYINQFQDKKIHTIEVKYEPTIDDYKDDTQYSALDDELKSNNCIDDKKYICDSSQCKNEQKCKFVQKLKIQKHQQEKDDSKKLCLSDVAAYQTSSTYTDKSDRSLGLYGLYDPLINAIRNKTPKEVRKCVALSHNKQCVANDDFGVKWNKDKYGNEIAAVELNTPIFARCDNGVLVPRLCTLNASIQSKDDPKLFDFDISDKEFQKQYCNPANILKRFGKYYDRATHINWSIDTLQNGQAIGTCPAGYHIEPFYSDIKEYFIRSGVDDKYDNIKIKNAQKFNTNIMVVNNALKKKSSEKDVKSDICAKNTGLCALWIIKNKDNADDDTKFYGFGLLNSSQWVALLDYYKSLSVLNMSPNVKTTEIKAVFAPKVRDAKPIEDDYNLTPYWPDAKCVPD